MTAHDTDDRDRAVITKYLHEAHGKEVQLETALNGQIALARSPKVEYALIDHLGVTRRQIDALERRIDELGGSAGPVHGVVDSVVGLTGSVLNRGLALAKLPLQALRGTSPADNELRSVRDCYWNEAEEIAHYRVIETIARELGDTATADLAARHRAEEEAMQRTLEALIPGVVHDVVGTETSHSVDADASEPAAGGSSASEAPRATATPATAKPAATKPTVVKPQDVTPAAKPQAAKPQTAKSNAAKPAAAKSNAAKPAAAKPTAAKPAAATKPKVKATAAASANAEATVKPVAPPAHEVAEPHVNTDELLARALEPKPIPGGERESTTSV